MEKRRMCWIVVVLFAALLWGSVAEAQDYPKSPIQIVIPFGPGGLTDIFWRTISDAMAKNINGNIVYVNKPGAGGVVGTSFAANAKPDGYTLVSANSDPLSISPVFTSGVPYNPEKDFTYLAKLAAFAFVLSVRDDSPFKTIEDVIAFAKANPKKLKCAVMGVGSTPYTILMVFNRDAKIEIDPVPFDSGGESVTNLLGGHTDFCIVSPPSLKAHVIAKKARILAICAPRRLPDFPEVPTMGERGYQKSSIATGVGLAGPSGIAPAIVSKWEEAAGKTVKDPKVVELIEKLGGVVVDFKSGEAYKKDLMADLEMFKEIVPTLPGKK